MTKNKQLFERILAAGLYVDRSTVPSQRSNFAPRYEVINARGDLLGRGSDRQQAIDQAWERFSQQEKGR